MVNDDPEILDRAIDRVLLSSDVRLDDLGALTNLEASGQRGWTLLMSAAKTGNAALVADLLEAGANPNRQNATGTTPLMFAKTAAFAKGQTDVMDLLIEAGARVDAKDKNGLTARDYTERRAKFVSEYLKSKEQI